MRVNFELSDVRSYRSEYYEVYFCLERAVVDQRVRFEIVGGSSSYVKVRLLDSE